MRGLRVILFSLGASFNCRVPPQWSECAVGVKDQGSRQLPIGTYADHRPLRVDEFDVVGDVVGDVGQQLLQRDRPGLGVKASPAGNLPASGTEGLTPCASVRIR